LGSERADFFQAQLAELGIERVLPVESAHVLAEFGLPRHHRDPFDRLLIAQAQVEGVPFVTGDEQIPRYPIRVMW
jgi:PIN domain nuclease of toxin-antitoxin system